VKLRTLSAFVVGALASAAAPVYAQEDDGVRRIEEVLVTAERQESTVSDTSISITALTSEFLEDFGIRNQSDLQNLIPATVILPYDLAIRGIGRPTRALGGDPGVATYVNGIYSEDFYIASSGGFWDIDRVEVLRGPQGTLYGRNAVGGAVNFNHKKPTDEFEAEVKTLVSNFDGFDIYGVVSGPLIPNVLNARATGYKRTRDGIVDEIGVQGGPDLDSLGDENYTLQLQWRPTDSIEINTRANERSVNRVIGGADGGGLVVLSEEGLGTRNTTSAAFGFRAVDPTQTDPLERNFLVPGADTFNFTNPSTGEVVQAQRIRAGLDPNTINGDGTGRLNQNFGNTNDLDQCVFFDRNDIKGDDLCAATNGLNFERFDHQSVSLDVDWAINDRHTLKYLFGYTDFFYDRDTDDDSSDSQLFDRQFYVSQEAEYVSHELQWFFDVNERLSFTTGIFYYDSKLSQRGDFFSSVGESRFVNGSPIGPIGLGPQVGLFSARAIDSQSPTTVVALGDFTGDVGTRINSGPVTDGSDLLYQTRTERNSYAAYTQGVFDISDVLSVTFGVRWAQDNLFGREDLQRYTEGILPIGIIAPDVANPNVALLGTNIALGAIQTDADGAPLFDSQGNPLLNNANPGLISGIPISLGVGRENRRTDDDVTWRVNFDYTPTDNTLIYAGVTTGYRGGGFNLVFFSATPTYDPEELTSYEVGFKGTFLDGTLQVNSSVYFYDYENIQTVIFEPGAAGGTTNSLIAVPGAELFGIEADFLYFVNEALSVGGNFSYTPSEYTADFDLINNFDADAPASLFTPAERTINGNGASLVAVPEWKWSAWAQYRFALGDNGNLDVRSSVSYIDEVFFTAFEQDADRAPAYYRWDARATWASVTGRYSVSAFVNNILDDIGIRQIEPGQEEVGFRRTSQVTEPRIYGVEFQVKLGPEY